MNWETVIGLEIHVQLATATKLFSASPTTFGAAPNTQAGIIDIALPGTLPVLNQDAIRMACLFGLSVGATIPERTHFARKNYFYPDLPKGYQISQDADPIVQGGAVNIVLKDGTTKTIQLERAHLEEDAGKLIHAPEDSASYVDLNRAGVPLLEIVSAPDMRSPAEAVAYLKTVHTLVRYLKISTGNMQEGAFRCDANVSIRPAGQAEYGQRVEIKNINSFKFVEKAITYEVKRQQAELASGGQIYQETRLYDSEKNETRSMRSKEDAHDYRYFPEPDLPFFVIEPDYIQSIKDSMPERPTEKCERFKSDYHLTEYDASVLTSDVSLADFFEAVVKQTQASPKLSANRILGEFSAAINKDNLEISASPVTPASLAELLDCIHEELISGKMAKDIFEAMWGSPDESPRAIIDRLGLKQISNDAELMDMIDHVLKAHPDQLKQYQSGQDKLYGFFVGQIMKATKGQAHPGKVNQLLKRALDNA